MSDDRDPLLDVASDLLAILALHDDLPEQAAHKATSRLMPGGLALVMLAPVASLTDVERRAELVEAAWLAKHDDLYGDEHKRLRALSDPFTDNDDDWEPPLQTLRFWSEAWRDEHGQTESEWTVQSEAGWLLGALEWAHQHEPHWDEFCRDVRAARRRLEDELHDGEREERSRVPCLDCDDIRLVKVYGATEDDDHHRCPRCGRIYKRDRYNLARREHLSRESAERFVPILDGIRALNRNENTVRSWLHRGKAVWYCEVATHRVYVWWPDLLRLGLEAGLADAERETKRKRVA